MPTSPYDPCPACGHTRPAYGCELPGEYDGVLAWVCGECAHVRPRFTSPTEEPWTTRARAFADRMNNTPVDAPTTPADAPGD